MADTNTTRALALATKTAKAKLGAAWDTMPCLRNGAVAVELLAIIASKDQDATSVARIITLASAFTAKAGEL